MILIFLYVALLANSVFIYVFRPRYPFNEANTDWDGKNKIYALKKEVAVMASKHLTVHLFKDHL